MPLFNLFDCVDESETSMKTITASYNVLVTKVPELTWHLSNSVGAGLRNKEPKAKMLREKKE